jgi:hypothetical protein
VPAFVPWLKTLWGESYNGQLILAKCRFLQRCRQRSSALSNPLLRRYREPQRPHVSRIYFFVRKANLVQQIIECSLRILR